MTATAAALESAMLALLALFDRDLWLGLTENDTELTDPYYRRQPLLTERVGRAALRSTSMHRFGPYPTQYFVRLAIWDTGTGGTLILQCDPNLPARGPALLSAGATLRIGPGGIDLGFTT